MPRVLKQPAARTDLIAHTAYLVEQAGEDTADRFLANAEESFALLAEQPLIGATLTLRRTELAGLRKWRVKDFDNVLIFYLPRDDGVTIVRVLHAARHWWGLLGLVP